MKDQETGQEFSMLMGDQEDQILQSIKKNFVPDTTVDIVLNESILKNIFDKARKIIRECYRKEHWNAYAYIEWAKWLNQEYKIPIYYNHSFSNFYQMFSGIWTNMLKKEEYVEKCCKEMGIDYKTYPIK